MIYSPLSSRKTKALGQNSVTRSLLTFEPRGSAYMIAGKETETSQTYCSGLVSSSSNKMKHRKANQAKQTKKLVIAI